MMNQFLSDLIIFFTYEIPLRKGPQNSASLI